MVGPGTASGNRALSRPAKPDPGDRRSKDVSLGFGYYLVPDRRMLSARPFVKRHHGLVRVAHWVNAIVPLGMIASGLQIYAAFSHFGPRGTPYPNPFDGKPLPEWSRLGGWLA